MTTDLSRRQVTKLLGGAAAALSMPTLSMAQARKRQFEGRTIRVGAFPISIDVSTTSASTSSPSTSCGWPSTQRRATWSRWRNT